MRSEGTGNDRASIPITRSHEDNQLLPIGKAYSGFTDEELKKLDNWVRRNAVTLALCGGKERSGVRSALTRYILLQDITGCSAALPRIHRIRWDKPAAEADTLTNVKVNRKQPRKNIQEKIAENKFYR